MKTMIQSLTILGVSILLALGGTTGCDKLDDIASDEVRFTNHSSETVTVYWGLHPGSLVHEMVLDPDEENETGDVDGGTVYYDWDPRQTVYADDDSKYHIVFKDR